MSGAAAAMPNPISYMFPRLNIDLGNPAWVYQALACSKSFLAA
jgi:hypothetical protein